MGLSEFYDQRMVFDGSRMKLQCSIDVVISSRSSLYLELSSIIIVRLRTSVVA
jgi:hypothetical protein